MSDQETIARLRGALTVLLEAYIRLRLDGGSDPGALEKVPIIAHVRNALSKEPAT